jgi:hypothetical protein
VAGRPQLEHSAGALPNGEGTGEGRAKGRGESVSPPLGLTERMRTASHPECATADAWRYAHQGSSVLPSGAKGQAAAPNSRLAAPPRPHPAPLGPGCSTSDPAGSEHNDREPRRRSPKDLRSFPSCSPQPPACGVGKLSRSPGQTLTSLGLSSWTRFGYPRRRSMSSMARRTARAGPSACHLPRSHC